MGHVYVGACNSYFAHPVCCAAAYATIKHILDIDLVKHVQVCVFTVYPA
jgi:adenosylmethionine-8-amino-7-oxononanoate aminotransferase